MNDRQKKIMMLFLLFFLGGGAYVLYAQRKKKPAPLTPTKTTLSNALAEAEKTGKPAVISLEEATAQLLTEMAQSNTNRAFIMNMLDNVTPEEFEQINALFGQQLYARYFRTGASVLGEKVPNAEPQNLNFWLKNELTPQQYQALKQKYPKTLIL